MNNVLKAIIILALIVLIIVALPILSVVCLELAGWLIVLMIYLFKNIFGIILILIIIKVIMTIVNKK